MNGRLTEAVLFGTNNVNAAGLPAQAVANRVVGSKVVLASRILYALL